MGEIHTFGIGEATATYRLKGDEPAREAAVPEFFVDGRALPELIGVERDLAFIGCDFCSDDPEALSSAVARYTGGAPPRNQFGSPRVVLYRCHCGSDYCGVISFSLVIEEGLVRWRGLSYEGDDGVAEARDAEQVCSIRPVGEIVFDKAQYLAEFDRYRRLRGLG